MQISRVSVNYLCCLLFYSCFGAAWHSKGRKFSDALQNIGSVDKNANRHPKPERPEGKQATSGFCDRAVRCLCPRFNCATWLVAVTVCHFIPSQASTLNLAVCAIGAWSGGSVCNSDSVNTV